MKITVHEAQQSVRQINNEITPDNVQRAMKGLPGFRKEGSDEQHPRFQAWNGKLTAEFPFLGPRGGSWGVMGPTSMAAIEGWPFVVEVLDCDKGNKLVDALREKGWREANYYRNSQWGTWKFAPGSIRQLKELLRLAAIYLG